MILTIKHKRKLYRRFEKDIWGLAFSNLYLKNRVAKFFFDLHLERKEIRERTTGRLIYRVDIINPLQTKKKFKYRFISLRLVRLFFLTLQYYQFRYMARVAGRMDGLFQENYCRLLEGRMISFLYRSNFLYNMFEIIAFVKLGNMHINNYVVSRVNYWFNVGDMVSLNKLHRGRLRNILLRRLILHSCLFNTPRYMYVSYKLMLAFMEKAPREKDLIYPIKIDIFRATTYY